MHQTGQYKSPVSIMHDLVVDVAVKSNLHIKPSPEPSLVVLMPDSMILILIIRVSIIITSSRGHVTSSCCFSTPHTIPLHLQCSFHFESSTLAYLPGLVITCHHKIPWASNIQNSNPFLAHHHNSQFTRFLGQHNHHHPH